MGSSSRIFEYFVVCGLGPEIRSLDGIKGFHGVEEMYMSAFLDQFPPSNHALYPPPPPQLPTVSSQIPPLLPSPRLVNAMERRSALGYFRPNSRQSRMDRIGDHRNTRIQHRHLVRGGLLLISIKRTLIVSESCCFMQRAYY